VSDRDGRRGSQRGAALPIGSAALSSSRADPYRYTIADLEQATEISPRNIRFYISQGLLPAARGRGVGATYGPSHLLRLRAIKLLKEKNTPLDDIRRQLEGMSDEQLAAMLQVETAPPEDRWRRILLDDDIELHVRERGGRSRDYALDQVVDTIVKQAEVLIHQQLRNRR
jgi:DNA-binding transcriptional MerR regulator